MQWANKTQGLEPERSEFKYWFCHLIAVGPQANDFIFLSLMFFSCERGITAPLLQDYNVGSIWD